MADISKITLPSGTTYNLKDAQARADIADIQSAIAGGVTFMGETTTPLTDGATTSVIVINGDNVTAVKGYLVVYSNKEFVFDGTKWIEMGDLSLIGDLGWKDSASGTFTPAGTVSKPTFTGTSAEVDIDVMNNDPHSQLAFHYTPTGIVSQPTFTGTATTSTGTYTPEGTVTVGISANETTFSGTVSLPTGTVNLSNTNKSATVRPSASGETTYQPSGSVSAPTISVATAGTTTTVNSITDVGTLPTLTTTVANENLTIGFSQGTLPTKGANTTVKTGDAEYSASKPTFTGTGVHLVTGDISVPTSASLSFSSRTITTSGTPSVSASASFTGKEATISTSGTPSGSVSQPTFSGGDVWIAGHVTATGTVSQPTFTGTQDTVTVT